MNSIFLITSYLGKHETQFSVTAYKHTHTPNKDFLGGGGGWGWDYQRQYVVWVHPDIPGQ